MTERKITYVETQALADFDRIYGFFEQKTELMGQNKDAYLMIIRMLRSRIYSRIGGLQYKETRGKEHRFGLKDRQTTRNYTEELKIGAGNNDNQFSYNWTCKSDTSKGQPYAMKTINIHLESGVPYVQLSQIVDKFGTFLIEIKGPNKPQIRANGNKVSMSISSAFIRLSPAPYKRR